MLLNLESSVMLSIICVILNYSSCYGQDKISVTNNSNVKSEVAKLISKYESRLKQIEKIKGSNQSSSKKNKTLEKLYNHIENTKEELSNVSKKELASEIWDRLNSKSPDKNTIQANQFFIDSYFNNNRDLLKDYGFVIDQSCNINLVDKLPASATQFSDLITSITKKIDEGEVEFRPYSSKMGISRIKLEKEL